MNQKLEGEIMNVRGGKIIFISLVSLLLLSAQTATAKEAQTIDELVFCS